MVKILFILTNHGQLGASGQATGWYLPEVAHPYNILTEKGHEIVIASPKGGLTPLDPDSKVHFANDPESLKFLANSKAMSDMENSLIVANMKSGDFGAVFFPGGHGPMFDLAECPAAQKIVREIYERGTGIVSGVCHGSIGLANVKLSSGEFLVKGRRLTGFSNAEEAAVDVAKWMPLSLEDTVIANGGNFITGQNWGENVIVDGRIITGQNPSSSKLVGETLNEALSKL